MYILGKYKQILSKVCPCDQLIITCISIKVLSILLSSKYTVDYVLLKIKEKKTPLGNAGNS